MKKIFLEYLNELIYMLKEYENSWWAEWMEKAYTKYRDENDIEKFLGAFGGMGSFSDSIFKNDCTQLIKTITSNMGYEINKNGYTDVYEILDRIVKYDISWIKECTENNRDISYYQENEKRLAFYSYLLENYVPGNLHEINTAYLKQSQINQDSFLIETIFLFIKNTSNSSRNFTC